MRKCIHCGGILKKDSRVCPWCGKAVGNKKMIVRTLVLNNIIK